MVLGYQLEAIIALAEEAGKAIMRVYGEADLDVTFKPGESPLTRADIASHHLILDGLQKLTPAVPVLSEESKATPYHDRQQWDGYWLIDPLDGTKEFIKRLGEFTVNIALIKDRRPVLGVVHAPALDLTYYAAGGNGAFKRKSRNDPVKIAVNDDCGTTLKVVASRSHAGEKLAALLRKIQNYQCISIGSSLKFCLVAEGSAHLYPRLGPTMEWDTAAGQCIVESAGGVVTDLQGTPLRYNKPDLLNPDFMVTSTTSIPWSQFLN